MGLKFARFAWYFSTEGKKSHQHRKRIEEESFRADSEFKIQETGRRRWHDDLYTTYELAMVQKMPIQSSSLLRMEKFQVADELSSSLPRSGHCSPSSIFPLLSSFSAIPHSQPSFLPFVTVIEQRFERIRLLAICIVSRWCNYIFSNNV